MGIVLEDGSGSLSTGSPAGRTPPHGDGSMYSQANVRAGKWLRPPPRALPSVIVDIEKVLREADGPMKRAVPRPAMRDGWKGVRTRVRLKSRTVRAGEEPEEHKRQSSFYHQLWINTWRSKFEQETDSILAAR